MICRILSLVLIRTLFPAIAQFFLGCRMKYKLGSLVTVLLVACSSAGLAQGLPSGSANSRSVCLSDAELDEVLVPIALRKLSVTLGICMRNYPNLENEGSASNSKFFAKYSADVQKNAAAAVQIFVSHGVTSAEVKQLIQQAHNAALKMAEAYDEKQCKNVVNFFEFVIALDSFGPVRTIAHNDDFQSARARFPACARPPTEEGPLTLDDQIKAHNAKVLEETKKRCLLPKSQRPKPSLNPLDSAIDDAEWDTKCAALGILQE